MSAKFARFYYYCFNTVYRILNLWQILRMAYMLHSCTNTDPEPTHTHTHTICTNALRLGIAQVHLYRPLSSILSSSVLRNLRSLKRVHGKQILVNPIRFGFFWCTATLNIRFASTPPHAQFLILT